jgi:hypothetical protein
MKQQAAFDLPFLGGLGDGEEVEVIGVFENLLCQVGVGGVEEFAGS